MNTLVQAVEFDDLMPRQSKNNQSQGRRNTGQTPPWAALRKAKLWRSRRYGYIREVLKYTGEDAAEASQGDRVGAADVQLADTGDSEMLEATQLQQDAGSAGGNAADSGCSAAAPGAEEDNLASRSVTGF